MSSEHESSYYEIALTNRQVLTIFVVLLTCLVVAFLSGVWIGRRDGPAGPLEASVGEPAGEQATSQMTELNFFSEGPDREQRRERAEPPPRRPATVVEEPAPQRRPEPEAEKAEPPAAKPPPPRPAPAIPAGGRVIQVFSTRDAAQADKLVQRLGEGGYPAYLVEESLASGKTYRVRVGPYQQEARAQQVADELRRQYRLETWITTQPG